MLPGAMREGSRMSHAIVRDAKGHRLEVDFGSEPVEISVYVTDHVIEIVVEAPNDDRRPDGRQCSLLSVPRHQFASAFRQINDQRASTGCSRTLRTVGDDA
jgi:hypothetical protein